MILRHLLGHTGVERDRYHASHPPGGHPDAKSLDDLGDDKDGNPRIGFDDRHGRLDLKSNRWAAARDGQGGYRSGMGCNRPWGTARSNRQC